MSPRPGLRDVRVSELRPGDVLHGSKRTVEGRRRDGTKTLVQLRRASGAINEVVWPSTRIVAIIDEDALREARLEEAAWARYDEPDEDPQAAIYEEEDPNDPAYD